MQSDRSKRLIAKAKHFRVTKSESLMVASSKTVLTGLATILIIVLVVFPMFSNTLAQTETTFTSNDKFRIPELNGSISFYENGTYSSATLQNNTWVFTDLKLSSSPIIGTLKISVENSNLTVYYYRTFPQFGRSTSIKFNVEGQGKENVNLGLNTTETN